MGKFQALLHKYLAIFVVLGACHEVVLTHGRQIKATNQHSSLVKDTSINIGNVPTSAQKTVDSTPVPNRHLAAAGIGGSNAENTNAYRPTTPGNSPGVGHRNFGAVDKAIKAKVVVVETPDVKHYFVTSEGSKTDFKPTNPGHSPGVGHGAHQNNNN